MVVPFAGSEQAAAAMLGALAGLDLGTDDELILVDNNESPVVQAAAGARVLNAPEQASSYFARNAGARVARGEWLLFVDSDCRPEPGLIERHLAAPLPERCAILAGAIAAAPARTLVAEYAASRGQVSEGPHLTSGPHPAGITANLMVRREAFEAVGGFEEGIRSGGDLDLCWRIQDQGWTLEHRPQAVVRHEHSERLSEALRRAARYGGGSRWIEERHPGASLMAPVGRSLVRAAGGALVWLIRMQPRRAVFKLIDGAWALAMGWGYYVSGNHATRRAP